VSLISMCIQLLTTAAAVWFMQHMLKAALDTSTYSIWTSVKPHC